MAKKKAETRDWEVLVRETCLMSYVVEAADADEARAKYENHQCDGGTRSDFLDWEVESVREF